MRVEEIWDKWMIYDDDGFCNGIDPGAPDEVKAAYKEYLAGIKAAMSDGIVPK